MKNALIDFFQKKDNDKNKNKKSRPGYLTEHKVKLSEAKFRLSTFLFSFFISLVWIKEDVRFKIYTRDISMRMPWMIRITYLLNNNL